MPCGFAPLPLTPQTAYTKEHPTHKKTYLCVPCCPKLGVDAFAKKKPTKKAPAKRADRKIVHYDTPKGPTPLADLCVKVRARISG